MSKSRKDKRAQPSVKDFLARVGGAPRTGAGSSTPAKDLLGGVKREDLVKVGRLEKDADEVSLDTQIEQAPAVASETEAPSELGFSENSSAASSVTSAISVLDSAVSVADISVVSEMALPSVPAPIDMFEDDEETVAARAPDGADKLVVAAAVEFAEKPAAVEVALEPAVEPVLAQESAQAAVDFADEDKTSVGTEAPLLQIDVQGSAPKIVQETVQETAQETAQHDDRSETRRAVRRGLEASVHLVGCFAGPLRRERIANISSTGMFVETTELLELNDPVVVRFPNHSGIGGFSVSGRIRWLTPFGSLKDARPGMGIEFVGLDEGRQRRIESWTENASRR